MTRHFYQSLAVAVCSIIASPACTSSDDILTYQISDGIPLSSTECGSENCVILILNPADCFSCSNTLPAWLNWGNDSGNTTVVVLTRSPTEPEQHMMMLAGIKQDGILRRSPKQGTPIRILLLGEHAPVIAYEATEHDEYEVIAGIAEQNQDH